MFKRQNFVLYSVFILIPTGTMLNMRVFGVKTHASVPFECFASYTCRQSQEDNIPPLMVLASFSIIKPFFLSVQYTAIFHGCKNDNFQMKSVDIFLTFAQNIDCGYTLEPPQRGGSNEYPQSMFWSKNKKNRFTRVNPTFFYIKVECKGCSLHGHVILMLV